MELHLVKLDRAFARVNDENGTDLMRSDSCFREVYRFTSEAMSISW